MKATGSVEMPEATVEINPAARPSRSSHSHFRLATTLEQVESAWHLVYERYRELGLIDENPFGIHAVPNGIGAHAAVIWGPGSDDTPDAPAHTLTVVHDNPMGLALDSVYPRELDAMRAKGCRLYEVGMLADHRQFAAHSLKALLGMMRWSVCFGLQFATDAVIGVHPRHAEFYNRCFGFEAFGAPTSYPMVRNNPVVPMRCRLLELMEQRELPRGLAIARDHPLPNDAFHGRFRFEPGQLHGSRIEGFMQARFGIDPCRRGVSGKAAVGALGQPRRPEGPRRVEQRHGAPFGRVVES